MRPIAISALAVLVLATASACPGPPDDPRFEACAEVGETVMVVNGTGELSDVSVTSQAPNPDIITTGDYLRALLVGDPATFELDARFTASDLLSLKPGFYDTSDDSLLELNLDLFTEDRHFAGPGYLNLSDHKPDWLAVFEITNPTEGYGAEALSHQGNLEGCIIVRSPEVRPKSERPRSF